MRHVPHHRLRLQLSLFSFILCFLQASYGFDASSSFPVSTRQALLQKSEKLNGSEQYGERGWSNRAATILTPVSKGIYTADRPFYWNKIDVGCRCTIVEMPTQTAGRQDLWVHSPVGLDGPLQKILGELGNVKYVVSPNYEHLKYAPQWHQEYPAAEMWGNPGLAERLTNIKWTGEVPLGCRPAGWTGRTGTTDHAMTWDCEKIIQPIQIDCETNPFTGSPFFNEVVYYHVPTKTLMCTDLFWNYPISGPPNAVLGVDDTWDLAPSVQVPFSTRAWKFGMDQVYRPFFQKLMVNKDLRPAYDEIVNHILNVWEVETLIPAHGDVMRGNSFIRNVLTKFF